MDETILQQILVFSPRLGAKREIVTWSQECLVKEEADGAVASTMGNLSSKVMLPRECSSWVEWWGIQHFQHSWTLTVSDIVKGFSCVLVLGSYLGKCFRRQCLYCFSSTEFMRRPWEYVAVQGNLGEGLLFWSRVCRETPAHEFISPVTPPGAVLCWVLAVSQTIRGKAHVLFTLLLVGGLRRYFPHPPLVLPCGKKSNWSTIRNKTLLSNGH